MVNMVFLNNGSSEFSEKLRRICKRSPFGAKVQSYFDAYTGSYPFLDFWLCEGGGVSSAICRYYSAVCLCGRVSAEAVDFITMLSPSSVLCTGEDRFELPGMKQSEGETLQFKNAPESLPLLNGGLAVERLEGDMLHLKKVFALLCSSYREGTSLGDFEPYFIDNSHMIRHGASEAYALSRGGDLVSTLSVTSLTEDSAVIGSVATRPDERGKGYAFTLVSRVTSGLAARGKAVFLHRKDMIPVYERAGFVPCGTWAEYTREP